jgi:hypothetical protein
MPGAVAREDDAGYGRRVHPGNKRLHHLPVAPKLVGQGPQPAQRNDLRAATARRVGGGKAGLLTLEGVEDGALSSPR